MRFLCLGVMASALLACGGRDDGGLIDTPDARPRVDGMPGADGGGMMPTPGEPTAEVTVPAEGTVITTELVQVTCRATGGTDSTSPIIKVSVRITGAGGAPVTADASPAGGDLWTVTLPVLDFDNGALKVTCTAQASDDELATDDGGLFLDLGPRILVSRPAEGVAQHGQLDIDFLAVPAPAQTGDTMAAVTTVTASIAGRPITLVDVGNGRYTATVRTDDPAQFDPELVADQVLRILATNARGVTRELRYPFFVDNVGPIITIVDPVLGEMVGGLMSVAADVVDEEGGVLPGSVVAVIANGSTPLAEFPLSTVDGKRFVGVYSMAELRTIVEQLPGPPTVVFPTVSVRATDAPGNVAAVGITVVLDYTPPVASLNPPRLREARVVENELQCGLDFDPLGLDATNDGQTVRQISEFRVRIEDRGNLAGSTSPVIFYFAGVDDSSVQLYVLDNTDEAVGLGDALVVDTDGDTVCDDINPMLRPTSVPQSLEDALAIQMTPMPVKGNSYFTPDTGGYAGWPACSPPPTVANAPLSVCPLASGLQRVIERPVSAAEEIYTLSPYVEESACMGLPFDSLANNIADGWACVAVRVVDKLGNVGVSRPIRVCIDRDGDGAEGCPALPSYSIFPDVPYGEAATTVPTANPPIDCTGRYFRETATTGERTEPATDCVTLPPDFPSGEVVRIDL